MHLRGTGVSIFLDKDTLGTDDVRRAVGRTTDEEALEERGRKGRDEAEIIKIKCERLNKIAKIAARVK